MSNFFNYAPGGSDLKITVKKKVVKVRREVPKVQERIPTPKNGKLVQSNNNTSSKTLKRKRDIQSDSIGRLLRVTSDDEDGMPAFSKTSTPDVVPEVAEMPPRNLLSTSSEVLPFVHSADVVSKDVKAYVSYFPGDEAPRIKILYPLPDTQEDFILKSAKDKSDYMPILEAISTMHLIVAHFLPPDDQKAFGDPSTDGILRNLVKYKNRKEPEPFLAAVDDFNRTLEPMRSNGNTKDTIAKMTYLPADLSGHILSQVYNRAVGPYVDRLRQYTAFSNNVYGELTATFVSKLLRKMRLGPDSVFVDMGCGVGNCVLQAALETGAESFGAEVMDAAAQMAQEQAKEFKARMRLWGLKHGDVQMIHADFLDNQDIASALKRADVVLCNNYAFHSDLNQKLVDLFLDLKDGAKVISLKSFVPPDYHISERNLGSPQSILSVKQYDYYSGSVSWTNAGGQYYIATVDRSRIQAFLKRRG